MATLLMQKMLLTNLGHILKMVKCQQIHTMIKIDVVVDTTTTDITERDSTATDNGWKFYEKTGVFIAADGTGGAHDSL